MERLAIFKIRTIWSIAILANKIRRLGLAIQSRMIQVDLSIRGKRESRDLHADRLAVHRIYASRSPIGGIVFQAMEKNVVCRFAFVLWVFSLFGSNAVALEPSERLATGLPHPMIEKWTARINDEGFRSMQLDVSAKEFDGRTVNATAEDANATYKQRLVRRGDEWLSCMQRDYRGGETDIRFEFRQAYDQMIVARWQRKGVGSKPKLMTTPHGAAESLILEKGELAESLWDIRHLFGFYDSHNLTTVQSKFVGANVTSSEEEGITWVTAVDESGKFRVGFNQKLSAIPQNITSVTPYVQESKAGKKEYEIEQTFLVTDWNGNLPAKASVYHKVRTDGAQRSERTVLLELAFTLNSPISDEQMALSNPPQENQRVTVSDVPYSCVWRDGRIRPEFSKPTRLTATRRTSRGVAFAISFGLLIVGLVALIYLTKSQREGS